MIEIKNLTFRYPGNAEPVLRDLSVSFPEDSCTVLMGANGSGKSTLARCMNGLLLPATGSVFVDGLDTSDESQVRAVRQKVGVVFQDPFAQMTSTTIERELAFGLENLALPPAEMHERVTHYLSLFGFRERRNEAPSNLSAGEMQRLALASVLILKPRYLVLDEATSLLSARSRSHMLELVDDIRRSLKIGVLLITQFPAEALPHDRLIVLSRGKILFDASPPEVFAHVRELISEGVSVPLKSRLMGEV
jgi:energy-coupling factor transport system ATP-binding protein